MHYAEPISRSVQDHALSIFFQDDKYKKRIVPATVMQVYYCKKLHTILHSGSKSIATLMKFLSRNGTRASRPQAEVDLFALKQSYKWRAFI